VTDTAETVRYWSMQPQKTPKLTLVCMANRVRPTTTA